MLSSSDSTTLDLWLNSQTSPHTRSCYRRDADRLLAHVGKPLNAIGLGDLQDFDQSLVKAGLAPVSRVRTLAAIKSLFSFCCRTRYLPANPAKELTLPPYEQRLAERIVAEEDVQRLLAVDMPLRDQVLLQLLYTAGLRVSEACGLRWRNLSARGEAGQVTVFGKNGRTRAVALPPEVWKMLNKLQKSAEKGTPVFASRSGQPLDRGRVRVILREAAEKAGVAGKTPQISPHWLRHAHASHALDHGAPIHLVQATLGHSSVATTSLYLHARPGDSSARFLRAETFLHKSGGSALPSERTGVMDVMATAPTAPGEKQMKTFTIDAENNITAHASRKEARESGAGSRERSSTAGWWRRAKVMFSSALRSRMVRLRSTLRHLQETDNIFMAPRGALACQDAIAVEFRGDLPE